MKHHLSQINKTNSLEKYMEEPVARSFLGTRGYLGRLMSNKTHNH